jgi:hypothetical protein
MRRPLSLGERLRDLGHARRYARMQIVGRLSELADAVGAGSVADALHDRWLLAGLAWEWQLPADRIGRDLFAEFAAQRSALAAALRDPSTTGQTATTGPESTGPDHQTGGTGSAAVTAAEPALAGPYEQREV